MEEKRNNVPKVSENELWKRILNFKLEVESLSELEQKRIKDVATELTQDSLSSLYTLALNENFNDDTKNYLSRLSINRLITLQNLVDIEISRRPQPKVLSDNDFDPIAKMRRIYEQVNITNNSDRLIFLKTILKDSNVLISDQDEGTKIRILEREYLKQQGYSDCFLAMLPYNSAKENDYLDVVNWKK